MAEKKFNMRQAMEQQNKKNAVANMLGLENDIRKIPFSSLNYDEYATYGIDYKEVVDLANSIATVGLEQNLVVKATDDPNVFHVVTGHKRSNAIAFILKNEIEVSDKVRQMITNPPCIVIPSDEDPLITKLRMHETNVHQRAGFRIEEIEDYLKTVEEAREKGIEINGKKFIGSSRAMLHARFNMSETMAKKYIKLIKEGNDNLKTSVNNGDISINNAYEKLLGKSKPKPKEKKEEKNYEILDFRKDLVKVFKSLGNVAKKLDSSPCEFMSIEIDGEPIDKNVYNRLKNINKDLESLIRLLERADNEE